MKHLLYIGNNLSHNKANITSIQRLGALLQSEGFILRYASHFKNKSLRLVHMLWSCCINAKWADIVLIDTYSTQNFWYAVFCSRICQLLRLPYIPILHGGNLPKRLVSHPKTCHSLFKKSHSNVSPSLYLKTIFEANGFSNTIYIPNAITIEDYTATEKTYTLIQLFWLRSFSDIYNPKMAVEVLKELKVLGFNAQLCMVGPDAGSMSEIKQLAEDLQLPISFTGKLSKSEWLALAQEYNIFINTSNFDNMPVSVIEAMALGFPIVSTNVGGIPFLIEDRVDGILVEKHNVSAMASAIIELFQNKKLREVLSKNARKKAESFDWSSVKTQWLEILNTD